MNKDKKKNKERYNCDNSLFRPSFHSVYTRYAKLKWWAVYVWERAVRCTWPSQQIEGSFPNKLSGGLSLATIFMYIT